MPTCTACGNGFGPMGYWAARYVSFKDRLGGEYICRLCFEWAKRLI